MNKVTVNSKVIGTLMGDLFYPGAIENIKLIYDEIYGAKQYEKGLEYIKTLEKSIVVDCGAHIGLASLYFNQAPNTTIYSLEPVKDNFEALYENVKEKTNIKPINIGLRSFSGKSLIDLGKTGNAGYSFFGANGEKENAEHLTIEDFLNQNNIDHVDLLKMDTEGCEYEVFLSKAFKRVEDRIEMIICEAHTEPLNHYCIPFILTNYDVEFLPFKNITVDVAGTVAGETEPFKFRVELSTIFTARRKR